MESESEYFLPPAQQIKEEPSQFQEGAQYQQNKPEKTQRKRRSKTDPEGRTYICGCGKMYLSYPALYTHIRTKHDGMQPHGTQAPQYSTKKKAKDDEKDNTQNELNEFINIRGKVNLADEKSWLNEMGYLGGPVIPSKYFPKIFFQDQFLEHPINEKILEIESNKCLSVCHSKADIDSALASFLFNHAKFSQPKFYRTLVMIMTLFRRSSINNGYPMAYQIIYNLNDFLIKDAPEFFKNYDFQFMLKILQHMSEWLFVNGFVYSKISLNKTGLGEFHEDFEEQSNMQIINQ